MIEIQYSTMVILISILWILVRAIVNFKNHCFNWKRELQLILVYICLIVVARFTFCPFGKVNGKIAPLVFDAANAFPPRINLIPMVNLLDYEVFGEILLNLIGNTTMFIPIGIIWKCMPPLSASSRRPSSIAETAMRMRPSFGVHIRI